MPDDNLDEIESCVNCGAETQYKQGDHIDQRLGYIEGAGQICSRCLYTQLYYRARMIAYS